MVFTAVNRSCYAAVNIIHTYLLHPSTSAQNYSIRLMIERERGGLAVGALEDNQCGSRHLTNDIGLLSLSK